MTAPPPRPFYDFASLYETARLMVDVEFSIDGLAMMIGFAPTVVAKWCERGRVPWASADRAAIALGMHPGFIWPAWWDDGLAEAERYDTDPAFRQTERNRRQDRGLPRDEPPSPAELRARAAALEAERLTLEAERLTQEAERREREKARRRAARKLKRQTDRAYREAEVQRAIAYRNRNRRSVNAARRQWADRNREHLNAKARERRARPDVRAQNMARNKAYYQANRERLIARQRERDARRREIN